MYEDAVRDYNEAIRLDQTNPVYVFNRADTKHEMERYEEAILDFDRYDLARLFVSVFLVIFGNFRQSIVQLI